MNNLGSLGARAGSVLNAEPLESLTKETRGFALGSSYFELHLLWESRSVSFSPLINILKVDVRRVTTQLRLSCWLWFLLGSFNSPTFSLWVSFFLRPACPPTNLLYDHFLSLFLSFFPAGRQQRGGPTAALLTAFLSLSCSADREGQPKPSLYFPGVQTATHSSILILP